MLKLALPITVLSLAIIRKRKTTDCCTEPPAFKTCSNLRKALITIAPPSTDFLRFILLH